MPPTAGPSEDVKLALNGALVLGPELERTDVVLQLAELALVDTHVSRYRRPHKVRLPFRLVVSFVVIGVLIDRELPRRG
jgi:hypothetical protein